MTKIDDEIAAFMTTVSAEFNDRETLREGVVGMNYDQSRESAKAIRAAYPNALRILEGGIPGSLLMPPSTADVCRITSPRWKKPALRPYIRDPADRGSLQPPVETARREGRAAHERGLHPRSMKEKVAPLSGPEGCAGDLG